MRRCRAGRATDLRAGGKELDKFDKRAQDWNSMNTRGASTLRLDF
jgi:hypothetical protein